MFQNSQVVLADERFLFEDQQVELLPARTTMKMPGGGGGKKKRGNNKAVAVATVIQIAVNNDGNVTQNGSASATATAG
jgi:hypothetical protein